MDYDTWKLSSGQEEVPVKRCDSCGGEIYEGEDIYKIGANGDILHYNCYDLDYANSALAVILDEARKED